MLGAPATRPVGGMAAPPPLLIYVVGTRVAPGLAANEEYLEYRVQVTAGENEWYVWRRFASFYTLKAALKGLCAAARAALPPKGLLQRHGTSGDVASARAPALERWLQQLVLDDRALTSPLVLEFLGLATMVAPLQRRAPLHVRSIITRECGGDCAETGDLVLFRTRATVPALQRAMTNSRWDHVGILVRSAFWSAPTARAAQRWRRQRRFYLRPPAHTPLSSCRDPLFPGRGALTSSPPPARKGLSRSRGARGASGRLRLERRLPLRRLSRRD